MNPSFLSTKQAEELFSELAGHVPVLLRRVSDARVIWLNNRVMRRDPMFRSCGGTARDYGRHILMSCGYAINGESKRECAVGIADRYGGAGIGNNGGSGRAVIVNGYSVKGIGRTPLLSLSGDDWHTWGGAFLDECVRETILSEIVDAEFPGGAIPTIAIIDTGRRAEWRAGKRVIAGRCCLLVRPCMLRAAHFERAPLFVEYDADQRKAGYRDVMRVRHTFDVVAKLLGWRRLCAMFRRFWMVWAEQLAYAFVHMLPHGGDTTSNIAFDGRLLDFGGMVAVPSLGRISISLGFPGCGTGIALLSQSMRVQVAQLLRYCEVESREEIPREVARLMISVKERYLVSTYRELLRLGGLSRQQAAGALACERARELMAVLGDALAHYQRDRFAVFDGTPTPRVEWEFWKLWDSRPPVHLLRLRRWLESYYGCSMARPDAERLFAVFSERSAAIAETRSELYIERKGELKLALNGGASDLRITEEHVDQIISETICRNRRDGMYEPDGLIPCGYARNSLCAYSLFRSGTSDDVRAIMEWSAVSKETDERGDKEALMVSSVTSDGIAFRERNRGDFRGAVWLRCGKIQSRAQWA